jgi:hypothetical protein
VILPATSGAAASIALTTSLACTDGRPGEDRSASVIGARRGDEDSRGVSSELQLAAPAPAHFVTVATENLA